MLELQHFTFIFTAINLLILYWIMKKILFKPVTEFMENRTNSIKDSLENSEKEKLEAAELKRKYEERIKTAKDDAEKIVNEANARASRQYDAHINTAKQDAEALINKAREEIEREREEMVRGVKSQVAGLALAAASKVLEANMDTENNRKIVDKFIDEAGAA